MSEKQIFDIGEHLKISAADLLPFGREKAGISRGIISVVWDEIMTMTSLPRTPTAGTIRITKNSEIEGLF